VHGVKPVAVKEELTVKLPEVKEFYDNPDSVKQITAKLESIGEPYDKEDSVKQETTVKPEDAKELYDKEDTVKQSEDILRKEASWQVALSEKQMQDLISRMDALLDARVQKAIDSVKENAESVKYNMEKENAPNEIGQEMEYEGVQSKFLYDIENYEQAMYETLRRLSSEKNVHWVNERLRCVIENIVRLSEYAAIDREAISSLADALDKITASYSYAGLPENYPFMGIVVGLKQRLSTLLRARGNTIPLRITFKMKAKLVGASRLLKDCVRLVKFSDLNFSEPHMSQWINSELDGIRNDVLSKKKTKKSDAWRERYRYYVEKGLIEPDDAEEDEDNE
jgi:hypothetical protein